MSLSNRQRMPKRWATPSGMAGRSFFVPRAQCQALTLELVWYVLRCQALEAARRFFKGAR